jgi:hypothetical protein
MYFSIYFVSILSVFIPILSVFAAAASICSNIINMAEGGPLNSGEPILISVNVVKEFQLVFFFENLESSYF